MTGSSERARGGGPEGVATSEQAGSALSAPAWASFQAGEAGRAWRIAQGEIMTYVVEGWVVWEFPGGRVERLARVTDFRDEDFLYLM